MALKPDLNAGTIPALWIPNNEIHQDGGLEMRARRRRCTGSLSMEMIALMAGMAAMLATTLVLQRTTLRKISVSK